MQSNRHPSFFACADAASGGATPRQGTILGVGTDLCEVARMQRALADPAAAPLDDLFTPAELACNRARGHAAARLAALFAAKEAVLKALATCGGPGFYWRDIEILDRGGHPDAVLGGRLAALAAAAGVRRVLVSCACCHTYATASAVAIT